eukprot:CAMPEP_0170735880 /NCGR_PEP_ID=MMETSP0437-20130122/3323_1 /TAXON_ID=0 /ORGANISM="Sexangularia sp." /LENGTH=395 /DNA_ID=CAMNT_0011074217 /DNA_START=236 /DNA_END=1424 /DNA_ORIENTATION=+
MTIVARQAERQRGKACKVDEAVQLLVLVPPVATPPSLLGPMLDLFPPSLDIALARPAQVGTIGICVEVDATCCTVRTMVRPSAGTGDKDSDAPATVTLSPTLSRVRLGWVQAIRTLLAAGAARLGSPLSVPSATQDEAALVAWLAACARVDQHDSHADDTVALAAWLDDTGIALGSVDEAGEGAVSLDDLLDLPTRVLLDPRLVGEQCGGLADALVACHDATPPEMQAIAVGHTVLSGRIAASSRFVTHFSATVRSLLPTEHKVAVTVAKPDPARAAWYAAAHPLALEQVQRHAMQQVHDKRTVRQHSLPPMARWRHRNGQDERMSMKGGPTDKAVVVVTGEPRGGNQGNMTVRWHTVTRLDPHSGPVQRKRAQQYRVRKRKEGGEQGREEGDGG